MWPFGLHRFCVKWSGWQVVLCIIIPVVGVLSKKPAEATSSAPPSGQSVELIFNLICMGLLIPPILLLIEGIVTIIRRKARIYTQSNRGELFRTSQHSSSVWRVDTYSGRMEFGRDALRAGLFWTILALLAMAGPFLFLIRMNS